MAYTNIDDPSAYFQVTLYSGTGSAQSITNDGNSNLQPDWMITKNRTGTTDPMVNDSSRGVGKYLFANRTNSEGTSTIDHTSFDSDGFSVSTGESVNDSGDTFVAWQWKANGGTTSSNTDGGTTSTVQANTTAGFSIVTWTGTGSATTLGHGLGDTPDMIIVKNRTTAVDWAVYHKNLTDAGYVLSLNTADAQADSGTNRWNHTDPTSSVFSVGSGQQTNQNTNNMVAYCFAEKQGYSKFGKYTGNGNANGAFVYTGFKPAFVMTKPSSATGSWSMYDHKRTGFNPIDVWLRANGTDAESTSAISGDDIDLYSNGFKLRNSDNTINASGTTYVYMAFAENPFVTSTGIPTTAR